MQLYFLLFGVFLIQEPVLTNALLLEAFQYHAILWMVHILFVLTTLFDAVVLYIIGAWAHNKFPTNRIILYAKRKGDEFSLFAGKNGKRAALAIYGPMIFPASAFVAPWFRVSFFEAIFFLTIGDIIFWYIPEWVVVLGVKTFIPDPIDALYAVIAVSLLLLFCVRYVKKRARNARQSVVK